MSDESRIRNAALAQGDVGRRGRGADRAWRPRRDERIHRGRLSEGRCPGAWRRGWRTLARAGDPFAVGVWTGASTAPELDGALAAVDGIDLRMPYQSDPVTRAKINAGLMDYVDVHLSHVAQMVWEGFFGHLDVALIEVAGITADGELIPSSSVGNNKTWIDQADRVILEVNSWQPAELEGMHDIYYGTALPPNRRPLQILQARGPDRVPLLALPAGEDRRHRRHPQSRTATPPSSRPTTIPGRSPATSWNSCPTR